MTERRDSKRMDLLDDPISNAAVAAYVAIGGRLAAQMAEDNFRSITAVSGWTMAQVEGETERAIERMEIASRDILAAKGADPDSERWREIWTAMESRYRQMMADLLRVSGLRVGEKLQ